MYFATVNFCLDPPAWELVLVNIEQCIELDNSTVIAVATVTKN